MESHSCDLWIFLKFIIFINLVKIFFCHLDNALINAKFTKFTNLAHYVYSTLIFMAHLHYSQGTPAPTISEFQTLWEIAELILTDMIVIVIQIMDIRIQSISDSDVTKNTRCWLAYCFARASSREHKIQNEMFWRWHNNIDSFFFITLCASSYWILRIESSGKESFS